jgi:hypothetical protein
MEQEIKLPKIEDWQIFTLYLVRANNNRVVEKITGIGQDSLNDMYIRITNWRSLYHDKYSTKLYLSIKTKHQ